MSFTVFGLYRETRRSLKLGAKVRKLVAKSTWSEAPDRNRWGPADAKQGETRRRNVFSSSIGEPEDNEPRKEARKEDELTSRFD